MKKHVLGMVKLNANLKGGQVRNLELDYLRLVYTILDFKLKKLAAIGYLFVKDDAAKKLVENWKRKYKVPDSYINIVSGTGLTKNDIRMLQAEKKKNAVAIKGEGKGSPIAQESERIGQRCLKVIIENSNPGVINLTSQKNLLPFRVQWDYYGLVDRN